jgi:hypothetical protein
MDNLMTDSNTAAEQYRKEKLIEVLKSYTSTREEYNTIINMVNNKATVKDYAYALTDGLKWGNWPWVNHSIKCTCIDKNSESQMDCRIHGISEQLNRTQME